MTWNMLNGGRPAALGFIPNFVWPSDDRKVAEQFNERYAHGGGWMSMNGWEMDEMANICYPGDEPLSPIAVYIHAPTQEEVYVYPDAWVAIVQCDGTYQISRMD